MATTQATSGRFTIVDEPTTPKQEAIVEAILDDPDASNATIADRVEDETGDRPSDTWVSRIRNEKLSEAGPVDPDVDWGDANYGRMRKIASTRELDVDRNPSKDDLADALERDGITPAVVVSLSDGDATDADAIDATVRNVRAEDAYDVSDDVDEDDDTTEDTDHEPDRLDDRIDALESTVEEAVDELRELTEAVERVEAIAVGEYTDDLVAEVLRRRADELSGEG